MENNYQLSRIHNYIHGLMSREEMFQLEREALEDPFLQDAIDGYRLQNGVDARQLSLLQQRLSRRVEETIATRHAQYYTWQRLAIGATAGVIFVTLLALLYFKHFDGKAERTTDVELSEPENSIAIQPLLDGGDATPREGWKALETYLNTHAMMPAQGGVVIIHFAVGQDGLPIHIQAEGKTMQSLVEEVIRLLRSGPKWEGTKGRLKITFPVKEEKTAVQVSSIKPPHCFVIEPK
ncbi:hypothetical protein HX021_05310 [Sphingobacterium sp. N143]|uniref:hypothetical protein n=1 Tax=Sphingobacterium sp. N143 TaxID=2746727 RepID=UPI0025768FEB|nr:hypothetical protein [Sphingobacterium sp. N143]MDM1293713.1 hypothetical protein [Sphingobacterium sp. N143]